MTTAIGMLVALAVAILGWVHFREGNDPAALIRASAFLVLAAQNALLITVVALGIDAAFGFSLEAPGQLPLWAVIIGRGVAAGLLVPRGHGGAPTGGAPHGWPAALVLGLPALARHGRDRGGGRHPAIAAACCSMTPRSRSCDATPPLRCSRRAGPP